MARNKLLKRSIQISSPCTNREEWSACREPIKSGWLTQGPKVAAFEKIFARTHRVKHALAATSCTTALHLALTALEIGPGDEVIVPAFTWIATANVVIYCGAKPVFADIRLDTYNIDPDDVKRRLTYRTKAIIPVHLFGLCADMEALRAVLPSRVKIIEDAACAVGAAYNGKPAGGLGDIGAFSFHPRKLITTGEGGILTTNDSELAELVGKLRNHGASISESQRRLGPRPCLLPEFNLLGFNYRMTDLQAAVGLVQLRKLNRFLNERKRWADWYRRELSSVDWLRLPIAPEGYDHAWQSYVTYVDPAHAPLSRDEIMDELYRKGIETRPGTHAVHMLGYYRKRFGLHSKDYPVARNCYMNTMAIPLHNRMSREDYEYVAKALKDIS